MKKILFPCLLIIACSSAPEAPEPPSDLMDSDKLKSVLIDIHLMEAYVGEMKLPEDSLKLALPVYYNDIFERHNINKEAFMSSFNYYVDNPTKLDTVYENMLDSLKMLQINQLR